MWVLVVCVGILWGNQCEMKYYFKYKTQQECIKNQNKAMNKLKDGYAVCIEKEKQNEQ